LEVADPGTDKADLFREAMKVFGRVQAGNRLAALGGKATAPRERTLSDLRQLRSSTVANTDETLAWIEREQLQDSGCGAIELPLLG
jgi:hypothetical protein